MDEIQDTKGFLQSISDSIHFFIKGSVPDDFILITQIFAKLLLLIAMMIVLDLIFKIIFRGIHSVFYKKFSKEPFLEALYTSKVLSSIANFLALGISQQLIYSVFYRHPKSYVFLERTLNVAMIIAGWYLYKRILKSVEKYYSLKNDYYRITAIHATTQSLNIIGILVFVFLGISSVFGISPSAILTMLTAMTAVIVLVFRDTILGFVTGIHVSISRSVKVGDWIGIPKYNIEGNILEINLLTTKIQNFDKTISTVPTYDLMSTEIRNHQVMAEGSVRRIKKSIVFNVKSFKFIDEVLFERLKKINLISEYLQSKQDEISVEKQNLKNNDLIINGKQLTNIGVFRKYTQNYLSQNPKIEKNETILVRQLEITPQGMPMEIYCFAKREDLADYENIQADIFDHLLSAINEFDLEVVQINFPKS